MDRPAGSGGHSLKAGTEVAGVPAWAGGIAVAGVPGWAGGIMTGPMGPEAGPPAQ